MAVVDRPARSAPTAVHEDTGSGNLTHGGKDSCNMKVGISVNYFLGILLESDLSLYSTGGFLCFFFVGN